MRATTLLRRILDLQQTKVINFELLPFGLVLDVAPTWRRPRCSGCGRQCRTCYDARERFWRHQDFAGMRVDLRYRIRRAHCRRCGVTTEAVPWAAPSSWFTLDFEHTVAMLAQKTDKSAIREIMGVAWQTVGKIVGRVMARSGQEDLLADLTQIGIDEISYKRHHHYLTIVTDHQRGRVVWVGVGKCADTVRSFFAELGKERAAKIELVSIDMSAAYIEAVTECAPNAAIVFDRWHVQRLAHNALDEVRREQARSLRGTDEAAAVKKTRWALQKNPWNLTTAEHEKLATVQAKNRPLYRAYLLKESLCAQLDRNQPNVAREKLVDWMSWAARSRLEPFAKLARTIRTHLDGIIAYVRTGLSNGRSEGINRKVRTITTRSYGFHEPSSLIAMIRLCCTGLALMPIRHLPNIRYSRT